MTNQSQYFEDGSARRESFADSVVSRERKAHRLIAIRNPSTQAVIMFSIWGRLTFTNHSEPSWSMIHFSLWVKNILNFTPSLWRKEIEHKSYNAFFWKEVSLLGTYAVFITNDLHHLTQFFLLVCAFHRALCSVSIFSSLPATLSSDRWGRWHFWAVENSLVVSGIVKWFPKS